MKLKSEENPFNSLQFGSFFTLFVNFVTTPLGLVISSNAKATEIFIILS